MKGGPYNNWNVKRRSKAAYRIVRAIGEDPHESETSEEDERRKKEEERQKKLTNCVEERSGREQLKRERKHTEAMRGQGE
jgi:hypothetical protein